LEHGHCLQVLVVRVRSAGVRRLADRPISMKGVTHGRLAITGAEGELK